MFDVKLFHRGLEFEGFLGNQNGKYGGVYKVSCGGEVYALKLITTPQDEPDAFLSEGHQREYRALELLATVPHFPVAFDYFETSDGRNFAILEEYISGDILQNRKTPFERLLIKRQLVNSLGQAYELGVTNLHVHPGNIMISPCGTQGTMIDLGEVYLVGEESVNPEDIARFKCEDFNSLENCFRKRRFWKDE